MDLSPVTMTNMRVCVNARACVCGWVRAEINEMNVSYDGYALIRPTSQVLDSSPGPVRVTDPGLTYLKFKQFAAH